MPRSESSPLNLYNHFIQQNSIRNHTSHFSWQWNAARVSVWTVLLAALFVLPLCLPFPASASPVIARSLTEALASAYTNNPRLLAERAQLRATDEKLPQALADWRPTVDLNASRGFGHQDISGGSALQNSLFQGQLPTNAYGATVTEPLFRGGRTVAASTQARAEIYAERANLLSVEQTVLLQVVTDYANILLDQATLDIRIEAEQALDTIFRGTSARYTGGEVGRTDLATAEAAYRGAAAQRMLAQSDLDAARLLFQRDTGVLPAKLEYPSAKPVLPIDVTQASDFAAKLNPDVVAAQYHARAASAAIDEAIGQALPEVDLQLGYDHQDDGSFKHSREDTESLQFLLKWRLYQGGANESRAREAAQTLAMYRAQIDSARQKAAADAGTAWTKLELSRAVIESLRLQVRASETSRTGVQLQQRAGERSLLDVLAAERDLRDAKISLAQAQHEELVQEYTLLAALGGMTAGQLRLPVVIYDPIANYNEFRGSWFGFGID